MSIECSDKAAAEFGRMFPHVRTIRCPAGAGPGGGRNVLLLAARGEYVAFTDDDCLAQCDWLRRLIAACRSRNGDPVRGWLGTAYPYSLVSRAQQAARLGPVRPRKPRLTAGLGGCNMCLARALIDRTGARFAEGVYGAEEIAFLQGLGVRRVLLEPAAIVRHLRNDSVGGMLGRSFRLGRGSGRLRWQLGLRGAVFARHVYLAPLLAPLLIGLSCLRTLCRAPHAVFSVILFSPAEIASAVSYTAGFIVGALQARRDAPSGPAPAPNA